MKQLYVYRYTAASQTFGESMVGDDMVGRYSVKQHGNLEMRAFTDNLIL